MTLYGWSDERAKGRGVGLKTGEMKFSWDVKLLFVDDTALVSYSAKKTKILVSEFGKINLRRKLRVKVRKSKAMRCIPSVDHRPFRVQMN